MNSRILRIVCTLLLAFLLFSCGPSDTASPVRPSQKIGPMWVNRYGHTNAEFIWNHCNDSMTETPGIQTTACTVPWVDELFIGYGVQAVDKKQRDALWEARTWELFIDGREVDLPAFNIADFDVERDEIKYEYRLWRIRLRKIPAGEHMLRYVMHVNQPVEGDPASQSVGTYELVVNFTFEAK